MSHIGKPSGPIESKPPSVAYCIGKKSFHLYATAAASETKIRRTMSRQKLGDVSYEWLYDFQWNQGA